MGFLIGIIKKILKLILYLAIVIAVILLIPNLPPYTKFTSIEIEPTQPLVGALAPNGALNNAEHLFEGKLLGPEYYQIYNDEVYTGLATGEIVKISPGGHVTFVTKLGQPCVGLIQEHICGRPLGFAIDEKNKEIYIADAYHGIWKVNLVTDKKQLLISPQVPINGRTPKLFNSVALDKNGDFYWTDSSSDYQLKDGVMAIISDPLGRLLHYNAAKNESKVLLDELWFANGLIISPDNQFVLVAESNKYRLIKYYINGPNKGKSEVFVAGLPGYPDTVRTLPDGSGVLISLYSSFDDSHPMVLKTLAAAPLARKFIARFFRLIEIPFEFLNSQFQHHIFEEIVYYVGSFSSASFLGSGMSGLVQVDWNGKIVTAYYNTDGSLQHISDAIVYKDKLYTGSPHRQNYVGAVPAPPLLKKAFSVNKLAVEEQPKINAKASEQVKPKVEAKKETKPKIVSEKAEVKPKVAAKEAEVKAKVVPKQAEVKPKIVPKEAEVKPKAAAKEAEVKAKVIPKEAEVKPKVVAKEAEVKPKVIPKEAEIKQKVIPKEAEVKPKVIPKEAEVKPNVVPKEAENKPKVVSNNVNKKPLEVSKESQNKQKEPEKNPKSTPKPSEDKPKIVSKTQDAKSKDTDKNPSANKIKSDTKETEGTKPSKDADLKSKSKESGQTKQVPKQAENNSKTKSGEQKSEKSNLKKESKGESSKKAESKSKLNEGAPKVSTKPIPVEEEIPSDTAKPSKETLKVIKKSGPQEIPNPNL